MEKSLFEENLGGVDIPERPDFSDDIRKFGAKPTTEKRENLQCWFFIDLYNEPEKFAEISSILKLQIDGIHRIDSDFFYKMVKEKFEKE